VTDGQTSEPTGDDEWKATVYPKDAPEDETDRAIKRAREFAGEAVEYLATVLRDEKIGVDDRVRAATTLLEVAGCL